MSAARTWRCGKIGVHIQEARAGDVAGEVELATALRLPELPATVDELVAQAYQLPFEGGSGTEAGWIT
jgi:hypothetical protein